MKTSSSTIERGFARMKTFEKGLSNKGYASHTPTLRKPKFRLTDAHGYASVEIRLIRVNPCSTSGAAHREGRKERKAKAAEAISKASAFIRVHLQFVIFHSQWLHEQSIGAGDLIIKK